MVANYVCTRKCITDFELLNMFNVLLSQLTSYILIRSLFFDSDRGGYEDIPPAGGTLVLFKSNIIPHEVLDTNTERVAVVGWYNRGVTPADIASLASEGDKTRVALLAASAALISAGIAMIAMQ
jgi:hypothetical protein